MGLNAVLLGGNWNNGSNSGSRASNWNNSPTNSNNNIGLRCVCDDEKSGISLWHCYGTPGRPNPCGQPRYPASANTLGGLVERLVSTVLC